MAEITLAAERGVNGACKSFVKPPSGHGFGEGLKP